jgi:hypothetical protein
MYVCVCACVCVYRLCVGDDVTQWHGDTTYSLGVYDHEATSANTHRLDQLHPTTQAHQQQQQQQQQQQNQQNNVNGNNVVSHEG